jgi:hypothetical protein
MLAPRFLSADGADGADAMGRPRKILDTRLLWKWALECEDEHLQQLRPAIGARLQRRIERADQIRASRDRALRDTQSRYGATRKTVLAYEKHGLSRQARDLEETWQKSETAKKRTDAEKRATKQLDDLFAKSSQPGWSGRRYTIPEVRAKGMKGESIRDEIIARIAKRNKRHGATFSLVRVQWLKLRKLKRDPDLVADLKRDPVERLQNCRPDDPDF